ncbi:hypothetical protein BH09VER1_BH09VER1_38020 [soil metagenome]
MSASAPGLPENNDGQPGGIWLLLSLLVHGAILAGLIFLIPATEIAIHDEKAEAQPENQTSASPEQIQEVAEQIQATQTDEVKSSVEELLNTQKELGELQGQTQTEFATLAKKLAEDAPKKAEDALSQAVQAQKQAEKAQSDALKATEAMAAAQAATTSTAEEKAAQEKLAEEAMRKAGDALAQAKDAQSTATTAQITATQQMSFLNNSDEAKNAQAEATRAQADANTKQDAAEEARQEVANARRKAERSAANATRAQQEADRAAERVAVAQRNEVATVEMARQQQEALDQIKLAPGDANAQREANKVRKNLETARKRMDNIRADLARNQNLQGDAAKRAAQAKADAENAAAEIEAAPEKLKATQAAALGAQQNASAVQAKAQTAVGKVMDAGNPSGSPAPVVAQANTEPPQALEGKNLAELYNTAVETEKKVATEYQAIRAAQVALQKQIPLAEAQKYVQVAVPVRSALPPEAMQENVSDGKALEAKKAAIEKARQELASMVSLTRGMAYQARATAGAGDEGVTVSAEAMQAQANLEQQLSAMATEAEGERTADLSGLMKQAEKGSSNGGNPAEAGTAGATPAGGPAVGAGETPGESKVSSTAAPIFPEVGTPGESVPGRKIFGGDYGVGSKWMFIDTWWVIGPFPNPERRNIETRFPPESVVDLGASYPLEDGTTVSWHFVQNSSPMVRPPLERSYAIYYAYTELWFDEERDLWFATGSDDFSKIWINDLLVWASGMQHKSWRPNEGYRKVHFKQGLNRILLRVENGQAMCAFSFMLCMQKEPKP